MDKTTIREITLKALPILKEAGVSKSSLFGSYVRGEEKADSDIDMLVELPDGNSMLDLVRLQRKLTRTLGKEVDLLTFDSINPLLKNNIQKDQLPIL